jgi:membrane protease YdiL (CAAX protease family)
LSQLSNDEETMVKEKLPLDFSILGWCFALSFAPQVLFSFFVSVTLAINGLNVWETEDPQIEVMIMLGTSILSPLLFFPLIKFVSGSKSFHELLTYVNFKSIKLTYLCLIVIFTVLLEFSFDYLFFLLDVPVDSFTLEVEEFMNTSDKKVLVIIAICIIAPFMEEFIFRGWLFQRLVSTKLGNIGAVGISSVLFTLFHFQYQQLAPVIILLIYSIILGIVRLKTANLNYTIIAHMTSNSYVLFAPIWFDVSGGL